MRAFRYRGILPRTVVSLLLACAPADGGAAQQQAPGPACAMELVAVDRAFAEAMARLLAASAAEQCEALANQIAAVAKASDAHRRCYPAGVRLNELVAVLDQSARDLRQAQAELGCRSSASAAPSARPGNG
jgi:hypothetical protein